jgi:hypothetical protein
MKSTYTWKISALDCYVEKDGKQNIVHTIHWSVLAENKGESAEMSGSQSIEYDASKSFVDYENLTEQQVKTWLIEAMGEQKQMLEKALDDKISIQSEPLIVKPQLPWIK